MKALQLHRWDLTTAEAREVQLRMRERMIRTDAISQNSSASTKSGNRRIRLVAGADVALVLSGPRGWEKGEGSAVAGVVVYTFPEMQEIERASAVLPLTFPYVPGLLSFREIPVLLAAFEQLRNEPEVIFCDGQGYAHPRRFGLACHLGVLLDCPSIGVAKSVLIGEYREPARRAGSTSLLRDPKSGETLGAALRTADGVKPVYVSPGHRISLPTAVKLVHAVSNGYRIPRPTRDADHFVRTLRRSMATK